MKIRTLLVTVFALFVSLVFISAAAFGETVLIKSKEGVGKYLTDSKGATLYYFKNDSPGKSACAGECSGKWPAFHSEKIDAPKDVNAKDFGAITREDGKKQTTYKGYPLYYFSGDAKAGDTNGQGVKDVWFVIDPAKFMKK